MPEQVESPGYVPIPEDKIVDGLFDSAKDAFGFLTGRLTKARRSLALKSLESKLGDLLMAATAHEANGVKAGDDRYSVLLAQAEERIDSFCSKFKVPRLEVESQCSGLHKLRTLATLPEPRFSQPVMVSSYIAVGVVVLFLIGVIAGIVNLGYHFVTHIVR
jgi:hypothetical protein